LQGGSTGGEDTVSVCILLYCMNQCVDGSKMRNEFYIIFNDTCNERSKI